MNNMKVIMSTYHLKIKFLTEDRVEEVGVISSRSKMLYGVFKGSDFKGDSYGGRSGNEGRMNTQTGGACEEPCGSPHRREKARSDNPNRVPPPRHPKAPPQGAK